MEQATITLSRRIWRLWQSLLLLTFLLTVAFAIFTLVLSERTHVFKRSIRSNANEIARAVDGLSLTQHDFETSVQQTLAANQQAIAALSQQQSNVTQTQTLSETAYVIRLAYLENQYMRDPTTARQLLVQAKDRLETLNTPYANTLKVRVIRDIATLTNVGKPQIDLYLSRLDDLIQAVGELPTLPRPPAPASTTQSPTTPPPSWHDWLKKAGHKLDQLIVVQHIDAHQSEWLTPGALAVLKLGIQSLLWQAEWALVYPDPTRFAACMEQLATQLTVYAALVPAAKPLQDHIQQYRTQWTFTEPLPLTAWQWVTSPASAALLPNTPPVQPIAPTPHTPTTTHQPPAPTHQEVI